MCIYCDYCVYHYKSTELVSLYTLDIGLKINIIIIIMLLLSDSIIRLKCETCYSSLHQNYPKKWRYHESVHH